MTDDVKRWDLIHQKIHRQNEKPSLYAQEKEKLFARNSLVVDLGCGTGSDTVYFLKKGHSVVALDISEFALNTTQEKAKIAGFSKNLITRQMDFGLHIIPVKDASVDVVYSRISINYFGNKQTTLIFSDIYRVLKPGGTTFITLKSPDDVVEMEYLEKRSTVYEPNVYIEAGMLRSRFTKEQLEEMLVKAGISGFEVKPHQEALESTENNHRSKLFVNEINIKKI